MADVATSPPGTRATLTGPRRRPPWTTARARLHPYDAELRLTARRLARRRFLTVPTAATLPHPEYSHSVPVDGPPGRTADRAGARSPGSASSTPAGTAPTGPTTTDRTPPGPGRPALPGAHPHRGRPGAPADRRTGRRHGPVERDAPAGALPAARVRPGHRGEAPTDARDGYRAGRLPDRPGPDRPRRSPLHGRLLRHRDRLARAAARPMPRDVSRHAPITAHDAPSPTKARKFTVRHITPDSVGKA